MAKNPPAFQFYPRDFLVDTTHLTDEQVGIYIRLLCHCWIQDGLKPPTDVPTDDPTKNQRSLEDHLARLCVPTRNWRKNLAMVLQLFVSDGCKGLYHKRLREERDKQTQYIEQKSLAGKKSAAKRKRASNGRWNSVVTNDPTKSNSASASAEEIHKPIGTSEMSMLQNDTSTAVQWGSKTGEEDTPQPRVDDATAFKLRDEQIRALDESMQIRHRNGDHPMGGFLFQASRYVEAPLIYQAIAEYRDLVASGAPRSPIRAGKLYASILRRIVQQNAVDTPIEWSSHVDDEPEAEDPELAKQRAREQQINGVATRTLKGLDIPPLLSPYRERLETMLRSSLSADHAAACVKRTWEDVKAKRCPDTAAAMFDRFQEHSESPQPLGNMPAEEIENQEVSP